MTERTNEAAVVWLDSVRPPAWTVPGDLLGGVGGWVEVVRLDQLRQAVRSSCPCLCPEDMHIGEIGCPCGLPDEPPCSPPARPSPPRLDRIEFRFPGGRWERCPVADAAAALILFRDYDLRINGEVRLHQGSTKEDRHG